ncbi:MAG: PulJ/GspJ family protein [Planctomycetota bacterium]|jgi:prepilin-type N-terminal cleavage/methylation domain-containing protein
MSRRRGFTLIELIATIVVLSALGTVASSILLNATDGYLAATTGAQLHTEASIALDRIARELRKIDLDPSATGVAPDIDSVDTTLIVWSTDHSLKLGGTDLLLEESGVTAVLLTDVSAFTVAVFDESNTALPLPRSAAGCDPIRRVLVTITLTRSGVTATLRGKVFLRSTMTGAVP